LSLGRDEERERADDSSISCRHIISSRSLLSLADDLLMVTPLDSPFLLSFKGGLGVDHKKERDRPAILPTPFVSFISVGKRERSFSCHRFFLSFGRADLCFSFS